MPLTTSPWPEKLRGRPPAVMHRAARTHRRGTARVVRRTACLCAHAPRNQAEPRLHIQRVDVDALVGGCRQQQAVQVVHVQAPANAEQGHHDWAAASAPAQQRGADMACGHTPSRALHNAHRHVTARALSPVEHRACALLRGVACLQLPPLLANTPLFSPSGRHSLSCPSSAAVTQDCACSAQRACVTCGTSSVALAIASATMFGSGGADG